MHLSYVFLIFLAGRIILRWLPVPDDVPPVLHLRRRVGRRVRHRRVVTTEVGHAEAGPQWSAGAGGLRPQPRQTRWNHPRPGRDHEEWTRRLQPASSLHSCSSTTTRGNYSSNIIKNNMSGKSKIVLHKRKVNDESGDKPGLLTSCVIASSPP